MYRSCSVQVGDRELPAVLIRLEMMDFDFILGIDWLSAYHTSLVDCFHKVVTFSQLSQPAFHFYSVKEILGLRIILEVRARRLLNQGYIGYLASLVGGE